MSKNIVIQEGGIGKQLTADKLKTNLVGGGTCLWVPEDERQLISKTITANGTYNPSDDNCYGYSQVIVRVPGGAGGEGPGGSGDSVPGGPGSSIVGKDSDGDDAIVSSDPETGELSEEKLPSSIAITTPPSKISYQDGESISISGMVVKGYLRSGGEWGVVPNSEITISPTAADASQAETSDEWDVSGTDLNSPVYLAAVSQDSTYRGTPGEDESRFITSLYSSATVYMFQYQSNGDYYKCFVSTAPFHGESRRVCPPGWSPQWETWSGEAITVSGGTAYVGHRTIGPAQWNVAASAAQDDLSRAAATAVLGGHPKSEGGIQHIGVSWPRIKDGKVLETSFDITVAEGA